MRVCLVLSLFIFAFEASACPEGASALSKFIGKLTGGTEEAKDLKHLRKLKAKGKPASFEKIHQLESKIIADSGLSKIAELPGNQNKDTILRLLTSENPADKKVIEFLKSARAEEAQAYLRGSPGPGLSNIIEKLNRGVPEDRVIKVLNVERKASSNSLYTKLTPDEVGDFNNKVIPAVEEQIGLSKGTLEVKASGGINLKSVDSLSADELGRVEYFLDNFNGFKNTANRAVSDGSTSRFDKYDDLFKELNLTDDALKLSLKQIALGDFVVPMRNSWEVPAVKEPVEAILGVPVKYDGTNLIIKSSDIPEEKLLLLDKAIDNYNSVNTSQLKGASAIDQARQKAFLAAFETPDTVRDSLGARKALAPQVL